MSEYRVLGRSFYFLARVLVPVFVFLLFDLALGWPAAGIGVFLVSGWGAVLGLRGTYGSRRWAGVALLLVVLGVAVRVAPEGTGLHRALAFGGLAAIAVTIPCWAFLPPLVDAGPKGIRVRGERWISWAEVEGVDADHDALRIRVTDGPPVYVTTLELPRGISPVTVALRLDRIQDLSAGAR